MDQVLSVLIGLFSGLVGGFGGYAALIRARGQNKTEAISAETAQQQAFTTALISELDSIRKDNDKLRAASNMLRSEIANQEGTIKSFFNQLEKKERELVEMEEACKRLEDENGLYRRTFREAGMEIPIDQRKRER